MRFYKKDILVTNKKRTLYTNALLKRKLMSKENLYPQYTSALFRCAKLTKISLSKSNQIKKRAPLNSARSFMKP